MDVVQLQGQFATEVGLHALEDGSREASFVVEVESLPLKGLFLRVYAREHAAEVVEHEMQHSLLRGRDVALEGWWEDRPSGNDPLKPGDQRPVVATRLWFPQ